MCTPVSSCSLGSSGSRSFSSEPASTVSVLAGFALPPPPHAASVAVTSATASATRTPPIRMALREVGRDGEFGGRRLLGLPLVGPVEVLLGLPDPLLERGHGLLHGVERLQLEPVDGVDRRVDVVERGLELLDLDRR